MKIPELKRPKYRLTSNKKHNLAITLTKNQHDDIF